MKGLLAALVFSLIAITPVSAKTNADPYKTKLGCMSCHVPVEQELKKK